MQPQVFVLLRGQGAGLHTHDHILHAVEGFRDERQERLPAAFGAGQGIDIRIEATFQRDRVQDLLLLAQDIREQDRRVELPLVGLSQGKGRGQSERDPLRDALAETARERLPARPALLMGDAVRLPNGVSLRDRIAIGLAAGFGMGLGDSVRDGTGNRHAIRNGMRIRNGPALRLARKGVVPAVDAGHAGHPD